MIRKFRRAVQHNLPEKIIAFVVAVLLWLFVMNDQNPMIEGTFNVPVTALHEPDGYRITYAEKSVNLKVRGVRSLFMSTDADDFHAYLDLGDLENGRYAIPVQTVLPQGFDLISADPESIEVELDRIVQKRVSVDLIVTGEPASGMAVAKIDKSLDDVMLEGPFSAVERVARVIGYVGLSGNGADFSVEVPLTAVNDNGKTVDDVRVIPGTVAASVQLARGLTKKIVAINPLFSGDLPSGYLVGNVRVEPSKIEVAGEAAVLDSINAVNTEKISLAGQRKDARITARLDLPNGVTVTNREVTVMVEITPRPAGAVPQNAEPSASAAEEKKAGDAEPTGGDAP